MHHNIIDYRNKWSKPCYIKISKCLKLEANTIHPTPDIIREDYMIYSAPDLRSQVIQLRTSQTYIKKEKAR